MITVDPGAMLSVMNVCSVRADPSGMTRIRHRPKPLGDLTSTATATSAFRSDHGGPWGDVVGDERVQRAGRPIGNDAHPTSPKTLGRPHFHGYCHQRLLALGPAAGQPGLLATDVGLVDLHLPG